MMSLKTELFELSEKFKSIIESQQGVVEVPTEDFGWDNFRYESPTFRLAHVERYFIGGLLVLHVTCFPHKNSKAPVFGFDIVGGDAKDKIAGAFLDLSPIMYDESFHTTEWNTDRKLPIWATVFSEQFIAVRPTSEEHTKLYDTGLDIFQRFIDKLNSGVDITDSDDEIEQIIQKQNVYCEHQADNKRTFGALKTKIGEERAKYFMTKVLFPPIEN